MPCCEISDCAQMSKTIIAVRHFGLGGRESLETAAMDHKFLPEPVYTLSDTVMDFATNFAIWIIRKICEVKIHPSLSTISQLKLQSEPT